MNGRMDSEVFNSPLVLIDHSLVNSVANALALVGLPVANAYDTFDQRDSVKDEEIIEWLGRRGPAGIWVHADDRAKKRHKTELCQIGSARFGSDEEVAKCQPAVNCDFLPSS